MSHFVCGKNIVINFGVRCCPPPPPYPLQYQNQYIQPGPTLFILFCIFVFNKSIHFMLTNTNLYKSSYRIVSIPVCKYVFVLFCIVFVLYPTTTCHPVSIRFNTFHSITIHFNPYLLNPFMF